MRGRPSPGFGVLAKVLAATCLLLVALGGIVWAAVDTTRGTTGEAHAIAQVFVERVTTDHARLRASENSGFVAERIIVRDPALIDQLDHELATSNEQLATAMAPVLAGDDVVTPTEASSIARLRTAYPRYLRVRERILNQVGLPDRRPARRSTPNWIGGVDPLLHELSTFSDAHLAAGRDGLAALRRDGTARNRLLALLLGFALVSLIAIASGGARHRGAPARPTASSRPRSRAATSARG